MPKAKSPPIATSGQPAAQQQVPAIAAAYADIRTGIVALLNAARVAAARSVNGLMTASYWEIGRRIVQAEQKGRRRAGYGEQLIERLSLDLTQQFGRGFSPDNLEHMRRFFLAYSPAQISETVSRISVELPTSRISETVSGELTLAQLAQAFPLPWSAYVRLLSVKDDLARQFYEIEALRAAGVCGSSTDRLGASFTSAQPCLKTKWQC